jgi:hypothetical protein
MGTIGDPLPFIFLALAFREHFPPIKNPLTK